MAKVIANMSMSLDGFVATSDDGVTDLFGWYFGGDIAVPSAHPRYPFMTTSPASADHIRESLETIGALVCGRRLFDHTGGWNGHHPAGAPVFVVTHSVPADWPRPGTPTRFTFVTDGVESAIAQAKATAGGKNVAVASASIAQQCLDAGLLDEIAVDLIPVLLSAGISFFAGLKKSPVRLSDPVITPGVGVTHLRYQALSS